MNLAFLTITSFRMRKELWSALKQRNFSRMRAKRKSSDRENCTGEDILKRRIDGLTTLSTKEEHSAIWVNEMVSFLLIVFLSLLFLWEGWYQKLRKRKRTFRRGITTHMIWVNILLSWVVELWSIEVTRYHHMSFNFEFFIIWILSELHIGVGKDQQLRTGILEKKT